MGSLRKARDEGKVDEFAAFILFAIDTIRTQSLVSAGLSCATLALVIWSLRNFAGGL